MQAFFTLVNRNISKIMLQIKILELSAKIFAIGYVEDYSHEFRYVVSDERRIKFSGFCGGDIFVPTKHMADRLNGVAQYF